MDEVSARQGGYSAAPSNDVLEGTLLPGESEPSQQKPWGWWRLGNDDVFTVRQVVRYKNGVQLGSPILERVITRGYSNGGATPKVQRLQEAWPTSEVVPQ